MKRISLVAFMAIVLLLQGAMYANDFNGSKTVIAYVQPNGGNPTYSYGTFGIDIGYKYDGGAQASETDRTKFSFDLSSIPSNATINSVSLSYSITNPGNWSYKFKITQIGNYSVPQDIWQNIGSASALFSDITYGSSSVTSSGLTTLVNSNKGGTLYLGALSQNESSTGSYANLSLTLSVSYTAYASITADNNFTASGGTHGSVIVDGSTYTAPYTFTRATGANVTLQAVSPQTDNQGYQEIWSSSCDQSDWRKNGSHVSYNQSYSFTASSSDNGATYLGYFHQNRVTTSGTMTANETWISGVTLSGDVSIPSGVTLTITSCATVNLNGHSLISSGGAINNSGTISGLRATLTHNGSELKGLCGTVQAAVNAIPDNQYGNSYDVQVINGTISENVNMSNKFDVWFHGSGSTTISGTMYITNCEGCRFYGFAANALSLSGCVLPDISVTLDIGAVNPSLYAYNCTNLSYHDANVSDRYAYTNGTGLNLYQSSTSSITGSTLLYHNVRAILANASTVNVNSAYFCNNTYDLTTSSGATITALFCYFPGGVASTQGSGIDVEGSYVANCTGIPKRSAGLSKSMVENADTVAHEFMQIDRTNFDLAKKVRADISQKNGFDRTKYRDDYVSAARAYSSFMNGHPGSEYSKMALISAVHIYKLLGDYNGMNNLLQSVLADNRLRNESLLAKRFMIDYYSQQNDFTSAMHAADEILSSSKGKHADTTLVCDALYAKGYIYSHSLDSKDDAVKCFSEIISNYPDNSLVMLAQNELHLLGVKSEKAEKEDVAIDEKQGISTNCYPNPFNPTTMINYQLPVNSHVTLKVYDMLGREVAQLVNEYKSAGTYSVSFDASNLASGVYFYRIQAGNLNCVGKMLLVK